MAYMPVILRQNSPKCIFKLPRSIINLCHSVPRKTRKMLKFRKIRVSVDYVITPSHGLMRDFQFQSPKICSIFLAWKWHQICVSSLNIKVRRHDFVKDALIRVLPIFTQKEGKEPVSLGDVHISFQHIFRCLANCDKPQTKALKLHIIKTFQIPLNQQHRHPLTTEALSKAR